MKTIWDELRKEGYKLSTIQWNYGIQPYYPVKHLWREVGPFETEEEFLSVMGALESELGPVNTTIYNAPGGLPGFYVEVLWEIPMTEDEKLGYIEDRLEVR